MNLLLSCPKCGKNLQLDEALSGERSECPDCGQWFIVGRAGAGLPVVEPYAIVAESASGTATTTQKKAAPAFTRISSRGEAHQLRRGMDAETRAIYTEGPVPAGASYKRRKCAHCGSPMSISHGDNHLLDFLLPLGRTVYWECERCGKEIKVQSPWRLCLLLLASPLLVGWWFVFTESSKHHDATAPWWMRAVEDFAPHDSKGSFWYIFFLLLFALAPLALIRELIVRLRNPRIL